MEDASSKTDKFEAEVMELMPSGVPVVHARRDEKQQLLRDAAVVTLGEQKALERAALESLKQVSTRHTQSLTRVPYERSCTRQHVGGIAAVLPLRLSRRPSRDGGHWRWPSCGPVHSVPQQQQRRWQQQQHGSRLQLILGEFPCLDGQRLQLKASKGQLGTQPPKWPIPSVSGLYFTTIEDKGEGEAEDEGEASAPADGSSLMCVWWVNLSHLHAGSILPRSTNTRHKKSASLARTVEAAARQRRQRYDDG